MEQKRKWIGLILGIGILAVMVFVLLMNTRSGTKPQTAQPSPVPAATTEPQKNDDTGMSANASVIGYGGPVLVRLTLDDQGKIAQLDIGGARFAETEGVGSRVREDGFIQQFIGLTPPIRLNEDVDAVSGATVSSQAAVDAVNEAAAFLTQKNETSDSK